MVINPVIDRYTANQWKLALLPNFFVMTLTIGIFSLVVWFFQPLPTPNIGNFQVIANTAVVTNNSANVNNVIVTNSRAIPSNLITNNASQSSSPDTQSTLNLSTVLASQRIGGATFYLSSDCGLIDVGKVCSLSGINKNSGITAQLAINLFSNSDINQYKGNKFGFAAKQNQETRINFTAYNNNSSSYRLLTFDTDNGSIILIRNINPGDGDYRDYLI